MNSTPHTEQIKSVIDRESHHLSQRKDTWSVQKQGDKTHITYPHAETLIDIFHSNNTQVKDWMVEWLVTSLRTSPDGGTSILRISAGIDARPTTDYNYVSCAPLYFYTLVALGFKTQAIQTFAERGPYNRSPIIRILRDLLQETDSYFDMTELGKILELVESSKIFSEDLTTTRDKREIIAQLIDQRYELTKKNIKGINIEINRDKQTVAEKIRKYEFDEAYVTLLDEIDQYLNINTTNIVSAAMIGNLRSFFEKLFTDVANKICSYKKETLPKRIEGEGEMGRVRRYIRTELELSDSDHSLITKYIELLNAEGGHSFTSTKEYFRLAKNIGVEIALFILTKYEKKFTLKKEKKFKIF